MARGPLHDRDDTRSSPLLSPRGPSKSLYERDERGEGQVYYLSQLGLEPGTDTAIG